MPLPDDFSPWQHLHEMMLASHNRNVQQTFLSVPDDDISTSLGGMKIACLLEEDDTVDMTLLRLMLFYFVYQGALPTPVYGVPTETFQSGFKFHPQVKLHFKEDWNEAHLDQRLRPIRSEISFRLMTESSATMNEAKAISLANRIKEFFGAGNGFTFQRGPLKVVYDDKAHGYDLRLFVASEAVGVEVIQKVLEVQEHAFNEANLTIAQSRKVFPTVSPPQEIYGQERRPPRTRPTGTVRFWKAELHVWGITNAIILLSKSGVGKPLIHF